MGEIDEAAPTFFYKETCPHSMSLLEILTSYQKTFPSMRHADIAQASPDILGTPAIRMTDGSVYYGDKAFEFVRSLDESKRSTMSKRTSAPRCPWSTSVAAQRGLSSRQPSPWSLRRRPRRTNNEGRPGPSITCLART